MTETCFFEKLLLDEEKNFIFSDFCLAFFAKSPRYVEKKSREKNVGGEYEKKRKKSKNSIFSVFFGLFFEITPVYWKL